LFDTLLALLDQPHDICDLPKPIRHASSHCRGNPKRLVDADEVVEHEVKGNRRDVVFELLAESVRQPGESAHVHPHREVLSLYEAGGDVLAFRVAGHGLALAGDANCWTVAFLRLRRLAVNFYQLRKINIIAKGVFNGGEVGGQAISR
jgi:hypothetical protein